MKKVLNKWQLGIRNGRDYRWLDKRYKTFDLYFLKLTSFPEQGEQLQKKHYKGFWIHKEYKINL